MSLILLSLELSVAVLKKEPDIKIKRRLRKWMVKIFSPGEGRTHNPGMALQKYCSISTVRCRLRHWGTCTFVSPIQSYEQLRHFYSEACISSLSFYL